jgi:hypothetical protein
MSVNFQIFQTRAATAGFDGTDEVAQLLPELHDEVDNDIPTGSTPEEDTGDDGAHKAIVAAMMGAVNCHAGSQSGAT